MQNREIATKILKRVKLFDGLSEEQLGQVVDMLEPVKSKRDSVVIAEGDQGLDLYIILRGQVRVSKFVQQEEEAIAMLRAGALFGEMSILGQTYRSASVIAHTDVLLYRLDGARFLAFLENDRDAGYHVMREMCVILSRRLHDLNERYRNMLSIASSW